MPRENHGYCEATGQLVSQCRTGVALVATHTHFPALNSQVSTKRSRRT